MPQYEIQSLSQHIAARRSSSCHMKVHVHVSSPVMRRKKISIIKSVIQNTFFTLLQNSKLVSARRSPSCCSKVHVHVSWNVATKNFNHFICNTTHIFHRKFRNSKLVTAHGGTSQLVMLHECTRPLIKSCNTMTKNLNHYISNTTYIFHHSLKFKARLNTLQYVTARNVARKYASTFKVI
jgi:hypothetical protein